MANLSVVGQSVYRTDANPKVTGRALHVGNIEMPGMLHVAVLRSPYAHARIKRVDVSEAMAMDGVIAAFAGSDFEWAGPLLMAWPVTEGLHNPLHYTTPS